MIEPHLIYETVAKDFDRDRSKGLMESFYLHQVLERLPRQAEILDLGCGTAEPLARFFIEAGHRVTGVDAATAMLALCRERYPNMSWLECDMRKLDLSRRFDAIIAWDSFFHLPAEDQRKMFPIFAQHIASPGLLLFTSGPRAGIAVGEICGRPLFHASLDTEEYEQLLISHGFGVLLHRIEDIECGGHTVWLAQHHR